MFYDGRRNSIQKGSQIFQWIFGKSKIFFFRHIFYEGILWKRYRWTFVLVFYVHEEQYKKDIESSSGYLEDWKSFPFVELSYSFCTYTSPRHITTTNNKTHKPPPTLPSNGGRSKNSSWQSLSSSARDQESTKQRPSINDQGGKGPKEARRKRPR